MMMLCRCSSIMQTNKNNDLESNNLMDFIVSPLVFCNLITKNHLYRKRFKDISRIFFQ